MKKLITVLVFSGLLTIPWAVVAQEEAESEAASTGPTIYGYLSGGVEMGGGEDARYKDITSRWGFKGSHAVSEGLSAFYKYEQGINTNDVSVYGRLAHVGLDGGFGKLTLGQIWSASHSHLATDLSNVYGDKQSSGRVGNAVSYSLSAGAISMQVDAIMDGGKETDSAIDQLEFGLTFAVTDNISLSFAHTNIKDENVTTTTMTDAHYLVNGMRNDDLNAITVNLPDVPEEGDLASAALNDATTGVTFSDGEAYYGCTASGTGANACTETATIYVDNAIDSSGAGGTATTWETIYYGEEVEVVPAGPMTSMSTKVGSKSNHFAINMDLGGLSGFVQHSQTEANNSNKKNKATRYGVTGGIGDSGLSFYLQARSLDPAMGAKTTPWLAGLSKALGSSASAFVEYHDPDEKSSSGKTTVGLIVNF